MHAIMLATDERGDLLGVADDVALHRETSSVLTGGDVDADWQGAYAGSDEAVGGSAPTPDQDVVDEIARALGVERSDEEEFRTSDEILRARDRFRWHLERDAEDRATGRSPHRRRGVV
jgi:hypothetical protein